MILDHFRVLIAHRKSAFEPHFIFKNTLKDICEKGIRHYQREFQRCGFAFIDGGKCVAFSLTHQEHSDSKGTRFAGNFDNSGYSIDMHQTLDKVENLFLRDFKRLYLSEAGTPSQPARRKVARFREELLATDSIRQLNLWKILKSNKTCLVCLQSVPNHVLPCGHGYCDSCVKDFGEPSLNYECAVTVFRCVLCRSSFDEIHQVVKFKPRCAGIRVLTLDGGGIRGIVELAILGKLYDRIGLEVPIRDLFDLIMGTSTGANFSFLNVSLIIAPFLGINVSPSDQLWLLLWQQLHVVSLELRWMETTFARTSSPNISKSTAADTDLSVGGIISLGLALTKLSIDEMKEKFCVLATTAFEYSRVGIWSYVDYFDLAAKFLLVCRLFPSRYRTAPLKDGLIKLFGLQPSMFSFASETRQQRSTRVAVTSSLDGNPWIISNYSRPLALLDTYELRRVPSAQDNTQPGGSGFEREDEPEKEMKIWEA